MPTPESIINDYIKRGISEKFEVSREAEEITNVVLDVLFNYHLVGEFLDDLFYRVPWTKKDLRWELQREIDRWREENE
jgi:hypothetical protein